MRLHLCSTVGVFVWSARIAVEDGGTYLAICWVNSQQGTLSIKIIEPPNRFRAQKLETVGIASSSLISSLDLFVANIGPFTAIFIIMKANGWFLKVLTQDKMEELFLISVIISS